MLNSRSLRRQPPTIYEKPLILICCEGTVTEKSYFEKFRLLSCEIEVAGLSKNTIQVVKKAIGMVKNRDKKKQKYDQVWCLFDKDSFPEDDFNKAILLARENKIEVAYSNQSFEYWLILHFLDHDGSPLPRSNYKKLINDFLDPLDINFSKEVSEPFFNLLEKIDPILNKSKIQLACERALLIYNKFPHQNPAQEESSTTVFRLVEEIQKYL